MKSLLSWPWLLLAVLLFSGGTRVAANEVAAIRGTFYIEEEFEPGRFRTIRRPLTFRSICAAFQVSPREYRLFHDSETPLFLTLKPQNGPSMNLPSYVLLQTTGAPRTLRDSNRRLPEVGIEYALVNPIGAAQVFNAFRGTALGRVTVRSRPGGGSAGFKYEVSGSSTNSISKFRFTVRPCIYPGGCW